MPSLGTSKLALPDGWYRVDKILDNFEKKEPCEKENQYRSKNLLRYGSLSSDADLLYLASDAAKLAERLTRAPTGPDDASLACSLSMREFRRRVGGWVWELYEETLQFAPTTFTIACRSWERPVGGLNTFDPRKLLNEFLTDLNRAGGLECDGYLLAFLHSELVNNETYRDHFHGMGSRSFIEILDKLRESEKYKTAFGERPTIRIRRKPLRNVPYPLTYLLKSYWPGMYEGPVGDGKSNGRQSHVRRIREPYHSEVLMWMDQWRLEDITLLKNLRVGAGGNGLIPTKLYSHSPKTETEQSANHGLSSVNQGL